MRATLIVTALWLAGLGAAAQFGKISVLFDLLAVRYGAQSEVGIGLIVSVVGVVGLILGTTAGLVVARVGPRRGIVAALILGAVVSGAQAGLPPYPVMIALRVFEGVSHLAIVVIGPVAIAAVASDRMQGFAMTLWSSFFGVSFAGLALIAPPLVAWGGVGAVFWGHAAWLLACSAALAVLLPPDPPAPLRRFGGGIVAQHRAIYASPRIAAPAMGFVFYAAIYVAVLTLLPPMLGDARVFSATAMPLVSIVVSLTFGVWMLRMVSAVTLVQGGFVVGMVATAVMVGFWGAEAVRLAAALILAAAMGVVQGSSFAAIPQINATAEDRAGASGAVAQLGNLGTTTGTPILALMVGSFGVAGVAAFILPLSLAAVAVHWVQSRRRA